MLKRHDRNISFLSWRFRFVLILFFILAAVLVFRLFYLTVIHRHFLQKQGNSRYLRIRSIPAYRGMIADRDGNPLAVSTPVYSVWINPEDFPKSKSATESLSKVLNVSVWRIRQILKKHAHNQFVYIKRGINPDLGEKISSLAIPGVYLEREYRRYYPLGEAASQVVGFTNIDDQGQAGLELMYDRWLTGKPGKERVLEDRYRHVVGVLNIINKAHSGHDLRTSVSSRIQFLAYQVLKQTIVKDEAESGSVVVLNPKTGEILAMANEPSFNPNKRPSKDSGQFRNRSVTDIFEPGSTMKVFSIASALDSGKYTPETKVDTSPGWFMIGKNEVKDDRVNRGVLVVSDVLKYSSNVGVARITLSLPPEHLVGLLRRVGFGERTQSSFPGESPGIVHDHAKWKPFVLATLAFGYGISVTPLQLAHAYAVIANHGLKCPATFIVPNEPPKCFQVIDLKVADQMLQMLETVVQKGGTGTLARIPGYMIAGKTGTAFIAGLHGYDHHKRMASFVGIATASNPQLVVAVVVRNPQKEGYGGLVAAPAFAKIMRGALKILNIQPDQESKN